MKQATYEPRDKTRSAQARKETAKRNQLRRFIATTKGR